MDEQVMENVVDTQVDGDYFTDGEEFQEEESQQAEQQQGQAEEQQLQPPQTPPQHEIDRIVRERLERERRSFDREHAEYLDIIRTLQVGGFKGQTPTELKQELAQYYEAQGIRVPDQTHSDHDEKILAGVYADEIIGMGPEAVSNEYGRLAAKPNRTAREEGILTRLGERVNLMRGYSRLVNLGVDANEVLRDQDFIRYSSQLRADVPLDVAYTNYKALTQKRGEVPPSTGSTKSAGQPQKKEFYTKEEVDSMSAAEISANFESIEKSMTKWR